MRFGVLGPLMVWDGEGEPVRVPEAKVRALLADLLVHEGRPVSADRLVDDLWGDRPPGKPGNALQNKVSQLRRAIGRDRVAHQAPGYRLRLDEPGDQVDADRFRGLVAAAGLLDDPRKRAALLTEALELWRGPAYADFTDEEFVRTAARSLAEQRLTVLEERAEARLAIGDDALLVGELADLVARHPLRERLRAAQMRALYRAGRQSEALASYAELREQLADELGLDPSPELAALHDAVLRQDVSMTPRPSAAAPRPAPTTPVSSDGRPADSPGTAAATGAPASAGPRSNLPAQLTELVGRDRDLDEIAGLLGTARLVTLTGPGGVGKTRLAIEAATRLAHHPRKPGTGAGSVDGVWLVELAGRHGGDAADLAQAVAAVLGLRDDMPLPPADPRAEAATSVTRLAAALRDRRTLLVLDNCEQVVEQAAELAGSLLRTVPGLGILTTSQEPLGLAGEAVHLVEPLPTPDAVRLFAARAAAASPGFSLADASPGTHEAVAEICRRLDGIPLALELAATRVRALGVRELAARLDDRFGLLGTARRGAPARQRTLRAMIDWSWELLSAPERIVLRRLAAHRDGCTLEAAEAVCAGDGVRRDEVLDLVTRLVDRSLVVVVDGHGPGGPPAPRYRLLESVAAYATERLHEMEDFTGTRDRHLRYYLDLAERAAPRLRDGGQREWLGRLDAEAANMRAALDEAIRLAAAPAPADDAGSTHSGPATRLAAALSWWWFLRGRLSEGRRAVNAALDVASDDVDAAELRVLRNAFLLMNGDRAVAAECPEAAIADPVRRGRAVWFSAYGLFHLGDPVAGQEVNTRALDLAVSADDPWGIAAALALRAMNALIRGDLDTIRPDGLRSTAMFRELGDLWGELQSVTPLAMLAEIKGDYPEATRRQEEALDIARRLGLRTEVAARLSGLGRLALLTHDWRRARELHEEARELAAAQDGYVYGEVHAEMGLALGARRSGDLDAAEAYLLRIRDRYVSSQAGYHLLYAELGFTAELRGDAAQSATHHLRGLEYAAALAEPRAFALSLEGLAGAAALSPHTDRAEHAALLLGAADAARRGVDAPLPPAERTDVDRVTAAASTTLGPERFEKAFLRGALLAPEEAARAARESAVVPKVPRRASAAAPRQGFHRSP